MPDQVMISDGGGNDPGGGGWTATGWVPAFEGYNYVGNGLNDLFNYLGPDARADGRLTQAEIDYAVSVRGQPLNDIDALALAHDRGIIDPATGLPRDTIGQVLNDLGFAGGSIVAFFNDPIGNIFGVATAAFGILAAGYHALTGFANDIINGVRNVLTGIADAIGRLFDPIVLDLDGDGVELLGLSDSRATFDLDDDGIAERTGWVGSDDGLLVFDRNNSGVVDAANEISFVGYRSGARTDLEGLAAFDFNGDGMLTEADAADGEFDWSQLMVWRDLNGDGRSDAGELVSLTDLGIASIDLHLNGNASEQNGNLVHNTTTFTRADGTTGAIADVSFAAEVGGAQGVAVTQNIAGLATDFGASLLIIGSQEVGASVTGTANDDLIIFSEIDDVFLISGGAGTDTVVLAGDRRLEDFQFSLLEEEGLVAVREISTGTTFFLADDVENFHLGTQTFDLASLWSYG